MVYEQAGLLDRIAQEAGCLYVSDLRRPIFYGQMWTVLSHYNPEDYEIGEWNEAASYISGIRQEFNLKKQARDFLLEYCQGRS